MNESESDTDIGRLAALIDSSNNKILARLTSILALILTGVLSVFPTKRLSAQVC